MNTNQRKNRRNTKWTNGGRKVCRMAGGGNLPKWIMENAPNVLLQPFMLETFTNFQ